MLGRCGKGQQQVPATRLPYAAKQPHVNCKVVASGMPLSLADGLNMFRCCQQCTLPTVAASKMMANGPAAARTLAVSKACTAGCCPGSR